MKKTLFIQLLLCFGFVLLQSCNDSSPDLPGNPSYSGNNGENVNLSFKGAVSKVSITCSSSWYAETDDKWLQLSLMGGSGNETVDVVAAYNTAGEGRSGEIRIYGNGNAEDGLKAYSDASSPVQVITVGCPGGECRGC